jgi:hypothetical protein
MVLLLLHHDARGSVGQERKQEVCSFGRRGSGADDGAAILVQDLEPGAQVICVPYRWNDAEGGTNHSGSDRAYSRRKSAALFVTKVKSSSTMRGIRPRSVAPLKPSQFT